MPSAADKFITLARERFELAKTADEKQRERELEDLKFYAGEQWDDDLLRARRGQTIGAGNNQQIVPARPSLTINKTREPVRQVLNQERQSDLGIELIPADDWGETQGPIDHSEIELREGLVRRIQRDSEASDARTWAFARATIAGRGYYLVMTRYVPGKSADQEIYIERIYNQASVLMDPAHEQPDGSDADWFFYGVDLPWDVYEAEYPKSKVTGCTDDEWRALGDEAPGWFTGDGDHRAVRVMNYYYTERKSKDVYHLSNGGAAYEDELETLPPGVTVKTDEDGKEECHTQIVKTIKWAKINGREKLDETTWPGHFLPIIKVVGEELQPYDQHRRCEGIVRPMRDPCKGNNYIISKFVEQVGLTPIPPWMMAAGQDEGFEDEYYASTTRTLAILHYNQRDNEGQPVPQPPQRTNVSTDVAAIATGVQIFGQAIQATSVVPETALGNTDPTVKSGKLARALIEQGERGTSNFMDNLVRSMRHEARVVNDLLFPIYGRPGRLARLMNGQGEMSAALIGQPFTMQGAGKQAKPMAMGPPVPQAQPGQPMPQRPQLPEGHKLYTLTPDADFNVAIKISKSVETRRQQITEFLVNLISASPDQMGIIGDLVWKYSDLPDHQSIEDRYRTVLIPPVQQLLSGKQGPTPEQMTKQLDDASKMVEAMAKELDAKNKIIETDQIKAQRDLLKAQAEQQSEDQRAQSQAALKMAEITSRERLETRKLEVQLEIELAKLGSAQSMQRGELEQQQLHHHDDLAMREQEQDTQAAQAELDRQAAQTSQTQDQTFQASEAAQDRAIQATEPSETT